MSSLTQKILTFGLNCGLEFPEKVKLISKGVAAETYQITSEETTYIITRFLQKTPAFQPTLAIKTSHFFSKMGFPVTEILATGHIDSDNCFLANFSQGKVRSNWSISEFESIGKMMGSLHWTQKLFLHKQHPTTITEEMTRMSHVVKDFLPHEFYPILDETDRLCSNWPTDLPTGLIHGDIWYKNVLFEGKDITALLDFHSPLQECLIYDLGTILKGIYFSKHRENSDEKFNAFLSAYQKMNPLSQKEIEYLPLMLQGKILFTILFMLTQAAYNFAHRDNFLSVAMFNFMKLCETKEFSFEKTSL